MNSNHQDQDTDGYSRDQSLFEINELYRKANVQNFLAFQEFQRVLNSLSANQESLNAKKNEEQQQETKELVLETSQHLRNNIWSICGDLSSTAETIASHDEEPEKLIPVLEQHHTILQNIYQYWNLIEIFFLNDSQFLSYEMVSWLQSEKFSAEEFFEAFHSMTHPERYESTEWGYWDCVYEFIIQGKILQAMEFLKLHSEFSSFFHPRNELGSEEENDSSSSAPSFPGKKSFNSSSSSSFTAEQVQEFFSLLQSNPSLSLLSVCSQGNKNLSYRERQQLYSQYNNQSNSSASSQWSSSVTHYRERKPFLLLRVPEIDFLLRLLSGEDRAIEIQSRGSWKSSLLGLLVYRYSNNANSNQLTKANLRRILSEVIVTHSTNNSSNNGNNSIATTEMDVLTSIAAGQIGRTMKMIIESSGVLSDFPSSFSSSSSVEEEEKKNSAKDYRESHFSALLLLLAVHLSHLLLIGGKGMAGISELAVRTAPLDISSFPLSSSSYASFSSSPSQSISFIEEITLRALEPIQRLLYREELIREYLSALSSIVTTNEVEKTNMGMMGMDKMSRLLYREALLRRPIFTDEESLRISGLLYQEGWISESKSILLIRGNEWLAKGREGENEPAVSCCESTVAKAIWFFLAAENYPRVEAILDSALHRCMETTVECSEVIFNQQQDRLSLRPGRPALPRRPVDNNNDNENEEQEDDLMMETNGAVLVLIVYDSFFLTIFSFSLSSIEIEVNKKDRLISSLKETEAIVRAVSSLLPELEGSYEESHSSSSSSSKWKNSLLFDLWIALKNYNGAISLLLRVSDSHGEVPQREQQEQDQTSVSPPGWHSSREAASLLLSILIPSSLSLSPSPSPGGINNDNNSNNPSNSCPSKPLISLRYWPHLLELVVAVHHLTAAEELRRSTDPFFLSSSSSSSFSSYNNSSNSRERGGGGPVFHKKEISQFFVLLSLVETAPDKEWLFSLIQPRRAREGRVAVEVTWRQLKMNLTSLLTCSLLLSSSLQLKRRDQQQQTQNKGNEKKAVATPSATLAGSWDFIGTRTTSSSSAPNPFPSSMGDQHSAEQLFSFSYSVDDLLDGSAFLANDL
jgi:hypothetical protein